VRYKRRKDNIKGIFKKWFGETWRHDVCQDTNRWPVLVNAVMYFRVSLNRGISWLAANLVTCQKGLCSMKSVKILTVIFLLTFDRLSIQLPRCVSTWFNKGVYKIILFLTRMKPRKLEITVVGTCNTDLVPSAVGARFVLVNVFGT
jgi:hypothetical protein